MNAIVNFDFEGKGVRVVKIEDDPWFVGVDVCRVLEIKNESDALARLDADERRDGVAITDPIGREQQAVVISEPGVYRLVFTSRKPAAERFKRWLAHEVLPTLRKTGSYVMPALRRPLRRRFKGDMHPAEVSAWASAARAAHHIYGRRGAREIWESSPLPQVSAGRALPMRWNGQEALAHLLDLAAGDTITVGELVEAASADKAKRRDLDEFGLRLLDLAEGNVLFVADDHPFLRSGFEETDICYAWNDYLRRLPGAHRSQKPVIVDGKARRGVLMPITLIDDQLP